MNLFSVQGQKKKKKESAGLVKRIKSRAESGVAGVRERA